MSKQPAPIKVTSGGGFVFENKVAALFLSQMLISKAPFSTTLGCIDSIHFQTRPLGWLLDDVLLVLNAKSVRHHVALSIKSNEQFTTQSAPSDFVEAVWEQYLTPPPNVFNKSLDYCGLITARMDHSLRTELDDLIQSASLSDSRSFVQSVESPGSGNEAKRNLLKSFRCGRKMARMYGITKNDVGNILKCMILGDHDFEEVGSGSLSLALAQCKEALRSGQIEEAEKLWESLNYTANEYRQKGGSLTRLELIDLLRNKYQLKEFPQYQRDWEKLQQHTSEGLQVLQDTIGGHTRLERNSVVDNVFDASSNNHAIVLLGQSGSGKTIISKRLVDKHLAKTKILWWKASSQSLLSRGAFENSLGISYSLPELIANINNATAYLIIDGLDRVFEEGTFETLSIILQKMRLNVPTTPWRVIITSQSEEWERVQTAMSKSNWPQVRWNEITIEEPDIAEYDQLWTDFPSLMSLRRLTHLNQLLLKPKILDLVASKAKSGVVLDPSQWVGESDLIDWYWKSEVESGTNGIQRARFAIDLAEHQGRNLNTETPLTDISNLDGLDSLKKDRICKYENGKIGFAHDILGDWARQRAIIGEGARALDFIRDRVEFPLWHRPIRLYGLHLLERNPGIEDWRKAFRAFSDCQLAQDLLLDAAIFAAQPSIVLDRLLPDLVDANGTLLRRLIKRFLHVATRPNPYLVSISETLYPHSTSYASTIQRIPNLGLWLHMVKFLCSHRIEILNLDIESIAAVAEGWLEATKSDWPLRTELGALVIDLAERHLAMRLSHLIYVDKNDLDSKLFSAAIASCNEHKDRIISFALIAAGRRDAEGRVLADVERFNAQIEEMPPKSSQNTIQQLSTPPLLPSIFSLDEGEMRLPWPHGPSRRPDRAFRHAVLEQNGLLPLILAYPDIAREVTLALIIEEPSPKNRYHDRSIDDMLEVKNHGYWYPPFFTKGPFLAFLNHNPDQGVALILDLVNFVTDRWCEITKERFNGIPPLIAMQTPNGPFEWVGDSGLYYAYRDSTSSPESITSSLMALEKWFYDCIDNERHSLVENAIDQILTNSKSIAFAGLFSAIGRKHPTLFKNKLNSLITVAEFHFWEYSYSFHNHDYLLWGWHRQSESLKKVAHKWHNMDHRQYGIDQYAQFLFLNDPSYKDIFSAARKTWQLQFSEEPEGVFKKFLQVLIAKYDSKNWKSQSVENGSSMWVLTLPEDIRKPNEKIAQDANLNLLLLSFPITARQMLDGASRLTDDKVEDYWEQLQKISHITKSLDVVTLDDCVAAGITVLIRLQRGWLRSHPERERWCRDRVLEITKRRNVELPGSQHYFQNSELSWDIFCADAIPEFWADDILSKTIREEIIKLALSGRSDVIRTLFASAYRVRRQLGLAFTELLNSFLACELLKWQIEQRERSNAYGGYRFKAPSKIINSGPLTSITVGWTILKEHIRNMRERRALVNLKEQVHIIKSEFIGGKRSRIKSYLDIELVTYRDKDTASKRFPSGYIPCPNINLGHLSAAFAWINDLDISLSADNKADTISFWIKAFDATLALVEGNRGKNGKVDGTPSNWDAWVFRSIARLSIALDDDSEAMIFWKKVVDLDAEMHYWTDDFYTEWLSIGLSQSTNHFIKRWRQMIEYTLSKESWTLSDSEYNYDLEESWCNLLGIGAHFVDVLWKDSSRSVVNQMEDLFEQWARRFLGRPRMGIMFMQFLIQDAATDLRVKSLTWLGNVVAKDDKNIWREDHYESTLVSLLELCWGSQRELLRSQTDGFTAFKKLVQIVAERQNPIALQLLDEIVRDAIK